MKNKLNQPIEEKWKIAEDNIIDKIQDCVYGLNLNVGGKEYNEILRQIKGSIWLRGEIQRVFENLLEQERKRMSEEIEKKATFHEVAVSNVEVKTTRMVRLDDVKAIIKTR